MRAHSRSPLWLGIFTLAATLATVWAPAPKVLLGARVPEARHGIETSAPASSVAEPDRPYTLAELADLAEQYNPKTRVARESARVQAVRVGVARNALLLTLAGLVLGQTTREGVLFDSAFVRQTEGLGDLAL